MKKSVKLAGFAPAKKEETNVPNPIDSAIRETPPCKGCKERHEACWGKCEKYKEWKLKVESVNKNRREYNSKPFVQYNPFDY